MRRLPYYYVWDITSDTSDNRIYAVEYKGDLSKMEYDYVERVIVGKARRVAVALTGNRRAMMLFNDDVVPYEDGHEIVKVPITTKPMQKSKPRQRKPLAEYEFGDEHDWQDLIEIISMRMNGRDCWRIEGSNIDWQGRNGHKYVCADSAQKLLDAIYHEDIVRLYVGKYRGGFAINAPTHDTPMGSWYEFKPVTQDEYDENA